jgi:hypothetical protein
MAQHLLQNYQQELRIYYKQRYFSFEKVLEHKEWPKIWAEWSGVSYINARKKLSRMPYQLASF